MSDKMVASSTVNGSDATGAKGRVAAAAAETPSTLADQLDKGGRLVVPIGRQHRTQFLTRIEKDAEGEIRKEPMLPVAFVPLVAGDK